MTVLRRRLACVCLLVCSCLSLHAKAQMQFVEASEEAGFPDDITPTYGMSVGDINGDGLPDVFLNNHALRNFIFRNDPDHPGVFEEVHREVDAESFWDTSSEPGEPVGAFRDTHGAAWMDFDNDGDQDLIITTGNCCDPQFFVNDGGLLYNRTEMWGFGDDIDRSGRSTLWYDDDGDGMLEMSFVTTFRGRWYDPMGGQFVEAAGTNFNCSRSQYAVEVDLTGDDNLEMLCVFLGGDFARIWDVSTRPFQHVSSIMPEVRNVTDVVLGDFDGNLRTDLLLLKGALRPSELVSFERPEEGAWGIETLNVNQDRGFSFQSTGVLEVSVDWNGTFRNFSNVNIGAAAVNPQDELSFTLDPSDPDVQGTPPRSADIPEVNIGYEPTTGTWSFDVYRGSGFLNAYVTVRSDAPVTGLVMRNYDTFYDQPKPPTVLSNTVNGLEDVTEASGLTGELPCASGAAGDFDNDMDLDVYLVCRGGAQNLPNMLLENDGSGAFTAVPDAGGTAGVTGLGVTDGAGAGDSVVTMDYDLDGRLDLLVANGLNLYPEPRPGRPTGGPYELFNNQSPAGNWIQIDLVGTQSPRDAIGAKVYVDAGGVRQLRAQNGGLHRWSQNSKRLHFGLAGNAEADITVRWQNGVEETFENVSANRIYRITEGGDIESLFGSGGAGPVITVAASSASESAGTAEFVLSLSETSAEPVTVDAATADGSATAGSDYRALTTTVTFAPGERNRTVAVTVLDDGVAEGDETFSLLLSNPTGAGLAASSASGTILDDDAAACGAPDYDPGSEAAIFLWQSCESDEWTVRMSAGGGTIGYAGRLTSTSDFRSVSGFSLEGGDVVDATSDPREIRYELTMSGMWEDGFSFRPAPGAAVCFTPPDRAETEIFVGASRAAASAPFDLATLEPCRVAGSAVLDVENTSALEGDPALVFTVTLSEPTGTTVTFDYTASGDTATAGADFSATAGSATIPAGSTTTMISVPLLDDDLTEGDETVRLMVDNLQNAAPGRLAAEGNIRDDEGSSCGDPGVTAGSDAGLFVWRDCDSGDWRLRVSGGGGPWTVYEGSLTAGDSWPASAVSGVMVEDSDVIDVAGPTIDYRLGVVGSGVDGVNFPQPADGSLCLQTQAPGGAVFVGAGRTPVTPPVDLITLGPCGQSQGQPRLSVTALDAGEADGTASFQLQLSEAPSEAASVDVAVRPGTASAGDDFVPATFTAVFEPGQVTMPVPVTVIDDALAEGLETLRLELSNPQGLTSDVVSMEGIIHDDEPSPCGAPAFDAATDAGYFLWKDCGSGEWHLRAAVGSTSGSGSFDGSIRASLPWQNVNGHSVESTDSLQVSNDPPVIEFAFQIWGQWEDGVDFTPASNATACFDGTGGPVHVGPDRLPVSPPFDLNTLGACDVVPRLTVSPASAAEGGTLAFHASLTAPAAGPVSFDYQTSDGSAEAGADYTPASGTGTIAPGSLSTVVPVTTLTDALEENAETLFLGINGVAGATAASADATGTITGNAAGTDPTCGEPTLDFESEAVLAVWQDCGSGEWRVRATAGGANFLSYPGVVDSTSGFLEYAGEALESGDTLSESGPEQLLYQLNLSPPHYDGFRFRLNPGGTACLTVDPPAEARVVVGSGRAQPATNSFDLRTLEACGL